MIRSRTFAAATLLAVSLLGCKKSPPTPPTPGGPQLGNDMPDNLVFVMLTKQGRNLITSPTSLKMTYVDLSGQRQYILLNTTEHKVIVDIDSTQAHPYTHFFIDLAPAVLSSQGVKTFYLEVGGKTDTLYYDVQRTRPKAVTNQYDVVETLFNGKPAEQRTFSGSDTYYVLRRR